MVPPPVRAGFRTLAVVAPPVASRLAARLFTRVGPPARVREVDAAVHDAAARGVVTVAGSPVVTYAWGPAFEGAPCALLVHGWQRRASRFGSLVHALTVAGWSVESYDAPAHGDSPGKRLTALEHMATMRALQDRHGPYDAVVGHSLGAFAAAVALHDGFQARRFASLAAPTGFESVVASYLRLLGLPPTMLDRLCDDIARTVFPGETDLRDRFDLLRHPVPSRVATLFAQDTDDRMHSVSEARALHAAHPGSRLLVTSGHGHNGILDDPEAVRAVVDHLGAARA